MGSFRKPILEILEKSPQLASLEILRRMREAGYQGGKSALYALVASLRPHLFQPMVRFEGLPGEFSQHDFGKVEVEFIDGTQRRIHFFASRLKYSRFLGVSLVADQGVESLLRSLAAHLAAWGGAPLQCVFDRPKTIALRWGIIRPFVLILRVRTIMKTLLLTLVAGTVAAALDLAIGTAAPKFTRVSQDFPPFTLLPILSGAVGGAILASVVYSIIRVETRNPDRTFFFVSLGVFALSLSLPLRLSFTRSHRFAGVTPAAQMVLVLMHAIVAVVSFIVLTSRSDLQLS